MDKTDYDKLYKVKNTYPIGPFNEIRNMEILRNIPKSPKKILDVGCGRGFLDITLAKQGHSVVAVDFSEKAIAYAKELAQQEKVAEKITFIAGDLFELSLTEKFDLIICSEVIEHIKEDEAAVAKLKSFLKKDGILMITVPHNMKLWNKEDTPSGHFRRYSEKGMKEMLEKQGLKAEKMYVWGFPFMRFYRFLYRQTYTPNEENEILPVGYMPKGKLLNLYFKLSPMLNKIFYIDDIFNFSKGGIDLVAISRKIKD